MFNRILFQGKQISMAALTEIQDNPNYITSIDYTGDNAIVSRTKRETSRVSYKNPKQISQRRVKRDRGRTDLHSPDGNLYSSRLEPLPNPVRDSQKKMGGPMPSHVKGSLIKGTLLNGNGIPLEWRSATPRKDQVIFPMKGKV